MAQSYNNVDPILKDDNRGGARKKEPKEFKPPAGRPVARRAALRHAKRGRQKR